MGRQHPHFMANIENGLLGRRSLGGQITIVALVPQAQRALQSGEES